MKKYCFRIDDVSWDMNYENFSRIRDLLIEYDIKPLIGVIPNNKDEKLKQQAFEKGISKEAMWKEVRYLQSEKGWSVALHGYDHVYVNNNSGIFKVNNRSEFAGLSYEEQYDKINKGMKLFEKNGVIVDAFMAPAHSLDQTTLKVLKDTGITVVTDGKTLFPYRDYGLVFIPQVNPWPWNGLLGVDTACFHINQWNEPLFERLETYVKNNRKRIVDFEQVFQDMLKDDRLTLLGSSRSAVVFNNLSQYWLKGMGSIIKICAGIKHKLIR